MTIDTAALITELQGYAATALSQALPLAVNISNGIDEVRITGTPSFVLGRKNGDSLTGTLIVGAQPLAYFDNAIKDALQHP